MISLLPVLISMSARTLLGAWRSLHVWTVETWGAEISCGRMEAGEVDVMTFEFQSPNNPGTELSDLCWVDGI